MSNPYDTLRNLLEAAPFWRSEQQRLDFIDAAMPAGPEGRPPAADGDLSGTGAEASAKLCERIRLFPDTTDTAPDGTPMHTVCLLCTEMRRRRLHKGQLAEPLLAVEAAFRCAPSLAAEPRPKPDAPMTGPTKAMLLSARDWLTRILLRGGAARAQALLDEVFWGENVLAQLHTSGAPAQLAHTWVKTLAESACNNGRHPLARLLDAGTADTIWATDEQLRKLMRQFDALCG